jgi:hypothetical protein
VKKWMLTDCPRANRWNNCFSPVLMILRSVILQNVPVQFPAYFRVKPLYHGHLPFRAVGKPLIHGECPVIFPDSRGIAKFEF